MVKTIYLHQLEFRSGENLQYFIENALKNVYNDIHIVTKQYSEPRYEVGDYIIQVTEENSCFLINKVTEVSNGGLTYQSCVHTRILFGNLGSSSIYWLYSLKKLACKGQKMPQLFVYDDFADQE